MRLRREARWVWGAAAHADLAQVPTAGRMTLEAGGFASDREADAYDAALDARQDATLH